MKVSIFSTKSYDRRFFTAGKITEAEIEDVGRVVATFHTNAQTSEYINSFGMVECIRQSIESHILRG